MNIALVHEHLAQDGGAEKVLLAFQDLFPNAPTYTLVHDTARANPAFLKKDIRTSFLQHMPGGVSKYQWYLTLMPRAIESLDLSGYDVVLSSASAFAKGILTRPETVHICYCHSPTRYLWSDTYEYVDALPYPRPMKSVIRGALGRLRQWDYLAAQRPDHFIANSNVVRERIRKYYRRDSTVLYPPVDVERFSIAQPQKFFLTGGRLVGYKRYDMTVQAFSRLRLPLKIFGVGPELNRLKSMAADNIEFLGKVPDLELVRLYAQAAAFIHPQEEDFGITAVESMASGRPVIAYAKGGALETVVPGKTGVLFEDQTWEALADTLLRFKADAFDPAAIRRHAEQFGLRQFTQRIQAFVGEHSTKSQKSVG